jgi:hypothetical protein
MRLDRAERQSGLRGDFEMAHAFEKREADQFARLRAELCQRIAQRASVLQQIDEILRRARLARLLRQHGLRIVALQHRRTLAAPSAAIDRAAVREHREPREHAAARRIEPVRRLPHLRVDVGDGFFGIMTVAEHAHGNAEHAIDRRVVQLAERALIAAAHACDDCLERVGLDPVGGCVHSRTCSAERPC